MSPSQRTKKREKKKTAPLLSPSLLASVQPPVSSLVRHPWTRAYFVRGVRLGLDARAYVSASVTLANASFAFEAAPAPKKAPREGFQKVDPSFKSLPAQLHCRWSSFRSCAPIHTVNCIDPCSASCANGCMGAEARGKHKSC